VRERGGGGGGRGGGERERERKLRQTDRRTERESAERGGAGGGGRDTAIPCVEPLTARNVKCSSVLCVGVGVVSGSGCCLCMFARACKS
jgi:hypothetical protein